MFRRSFRLLSLLSLVALLGGIFPLGAAAQFPSQGQGGAPSPGGFPSSGGGRGGFYQGQVYGFALSWGPEWTLTQEAPEAVLSRAFSTGQSAMASLPSRMPSVSRNGEATLPVSR